MNNRVDYEKIRKKRRLAARTKQFLALGLVVLLLLGVMVINDLLVRRNVTSQLGDAIDTMGGSGYPVKVPSGQLLYTNGFGKNLLVQNDTNLYVYNPKGKQTLNVQQMNERSITKNNDSQLLVYQSGGRKFSVYSASQELFTQETDEKILVGDIGKSGDVVVITSSQKFVSEIIVYDYKFNWKMNLSSAKYQVSAVAMSPQGAVVAVGYVTTENGQLRSIITLYSTSTGEELSSISLPGQLLLSLRYQNEERLSVLTDTGYTIYTTAGDSLGSYTFPQEFELQKIEANATKALVYYRNTRSGEEEHVLLGEKAQLLTILPKRDEIQDFVLSDKQVYLLVPSGVERYDFTGELIEFIATEGVREFEYAGDSLYLFTKTELKVLEE